MMHNVHAPIAASATLGLDAISTAAPACDWPGESSGTVWYTLVDFLRTVVEARAGTRRPASHAATLGDEGSAAPVRRPAAHH